MEESLLHQILSHHDNERISMFSTLLSPSTEFLQKKELLPAILKEKMFLNNAYPWLKLNDLSLSENFIYYPLGLLFPHASHVKEYNKNVNQDYITQIANSTGVAAGATGVEAVIHGINDWVERDAYGLFLLNTLIKKNIPANCILKQTLPEHIKQDIEKIENAYQDELVIIDITSNLTIPAFFVSFTRQNVPVQPSGLGASLCKIDALQQALLEALQARDRYNTNTITARQKTINHYKEYPLLLGAFKCDLTQLRNENFIVYKNWDNVITHPLNSNLTHQLTLMIELTKRWGMSIYYNTLFQDPNGLTLTYILLTGVETFGLMREGIFIPIKKRGLSNII
jgi:ribosomal protein S12 methylthiotransferase accessory factor